ncbi:MAG: transglutaminase-like domain-containing protein [Acidithiobacillus ferriphilus]|jgi:transglutaminase-like putative cysteine protease|uniref:Transglutaminase n=2 Tax=Acidithiobacillus TaxID=119977 RepID=A0A179BKT6_ACIFR|nr:MULTISPECIES: transglutaminase family protein [Acidithiobacillus]MBU2828451.1 transglutaminase family protein [Acidithiobacillus ferriphilus]MBU2844652.1 transglutaminase family protein [Acidithiobacillus ferriphilus]MEB8474162.1 transglutaminase family protein [Acidithiobacillus ferriphilus]MEB8486518.1 transglutaminase family protein [Acidithiobacillus ferriphilus]MEB8488511.1 transglutaminase family protein [Acidithiobacillus ferriphilus]
MKPAKLDTQPSQHFLMESATVDYAHANIRKLAATLSSDDPTATARRCFEWVRDHIEHSMDFHREEVTCAASEVLQQGTGLCTAKSHLLVALWRANQIPAGFCYQRLTLDGPSPPYCTHGFTAVWLDDRGWYRCDARGNSKPGIRCAFTPGQENLAYPAIYNGEQAYPEVWAEPWPDLLAAMEKLPNISQYRSHPIDACPPAADLCVSEPAAPNIE